MSMNEPGTNPGIDWRLSPDGTRLSMSVPYLFGGQAGLVVVLPGDKVAELAAAAIVKIEADIEVQAKKQDGLARARAMLNEDAVDYSGLTQNVSRAINTIESLNHDLQHMKLLVAYAKNLQWYVLSEHDLLALRVIERQR